MIVDPAGPAAAEINRLFWVMLAVGTAVYLLVLGLMLVPWLRRRREAERATDGDRSAVPERVANRWIVAGGVVLPVLVLAATLAYSVVVARDLRDPAPPDSLVVELIAHQFHWTVSYPDEDVTVTNELHLPTGEPVELRVTSTDVIHSFWVPQLAGKIDALPDGTNTLVLEATEPGRFPARCAEFCGLHHATMVLSVVTEPRQQFTDWLDRQGDAGASSAGAEIERTAP